ncbi:unnamed protein product [Cuscuta epithymum]|uniref:Uncharacterized protein n=1 Tax=Cuscuta epithymum TaxID=186058 RepID=A0AAV0G4Z0_9ASTE|nr:unnamed protein product [Cuscuta epithymum]
MSNALVALTPEGASIPMPKLKNISRLRTEHHVYELPDHHPLLDGLEKKRSNRSPALTFWPCGHPVKLQALFTPQKGYVIPNNLASYVMRKLALHAIASEKQNLKLCVGQF